MQFERRQLVVAEERDDHVVVKTGLKPGEHVAANGSLVLAQLYEDQQMVATGCRSNDRSPTPLTRCVAPEYDPDIVTI